MITITTLADIETLSTRDGLAPALLQLLRSEFGILAESYGCTQSDLDLETDGPIFLLEPTDDPGDLPLIGLPGDSGGLLGSRPETVHRLSLQNGSVVYRAILIQNDEYSPTVFLCSGQIAPEVERWLETESQLCTGSPNDSQIN